MSSQVIERSLVSLGCDRIGGGKVRMYREPRRRPEVEPPDNCIDRLITHLSHHFQDSLDCRVAATGYDYESAVSHSYYERLFLGVTEKE